MQKRNPKAEILLRLSSVSGVGPNKIRALIGRFGFSQTIFNASLATLCDVVDRKTAERIRNTDGKLFARQQLAEAARTGTRMISFWDEAYPRLLKQIYDPPAFLFVKGEILPDDSLAIGVVGTRTPTAYGRIVTERLTPELSGKGLTIVSGLAYGVDTIAHTAALKAGGRTLAVLGSGVDVIYPARNKKLAEDIVENGALISEFPMGTKPDWQNFPRRNRLICGLSLGTVVIEAGQKSGALITAAMALDQNREVFAVPGNIDSPYSVGTNELIKQGAKLVTCSQDILDELQPHLPGTSHEAANEPRTLDLDEAEMRLFGLLSHEPKHIDLIAQESGEATGTVLSVLLSLELKNLVRQLAGKQFVKA